MNSFIELVNTGGDRLWHFAGPTLWQSSLLILALFVIDFIFRRRLRASIRYALWIVVLIKLLLPPTLALPTGAGWWLRHSESQPLSPASETKMIVTYGAEVVPSFASPIVTPAAPEPSISFHGWLLLGCLAVSIALLAWMLSRWILVMGQVRRAASPPDSVLPLLHRARELSGWKHKVRVQVTDNVMSPAVCGLFRPVILLPKLLIEQLSPEQIRAVLVHELVHLKRGDVFVNCAQALLQVVYWWHPLFWFANARIRGGSGGRRGDAGVAR